MELMKLYYFLSISIIFYFVNEVRCKKFSSQNIPIYSITNKTEKYYSYEAKESSNFIKSEVYELKMENPSNFNSTILYYGNLKLEVIYLAYDKLNIKIKDRENELIELPYQEPFPFHDIKEISTNQQLNQSDIKKLYEIDIKYNPFSIKVIRKTTMEVIFDTSIFYFLLSKHYLRLKFRFSSTQDIFGLGERTTNLKLQSGVYTIYNKDLFGEEENYIGGKNRYGSHPMCLIKEKSGFYNIIYLRNSYPMDAILDIKKNTLEFKITGGIFDFNFFLGDEKENTSEYNEIVYAKSPKSVLNKYHTYLGKFTLPPFWAMGFQQSRWGYKNSISIQNVLNSYKNNSIPLDVIWMDIDYMINRQPFTFDESRYGSYDSFNKMISEYNKRLVVILEPQIGLDKLDSSIWRNAIKKNIFIKNSRGYILFNRVWPGICAFFDFFNPKTEYFWSDMLELFNNKLNFSGIWLDMNEIATFNKGQVDYDGNEMNCYDIKYHYLPGRSDLSDKTLCSNAIHYNNMEHIMVHNFYASQEALMTKRYLDKKSKNTEFSFILSRANSPGLGRYASHWSGDNKGTQLYLEKSVTEIFYSNLFGIPHSGSDICGFGENTSDEMCAKWYQLGSLYPFSRSHNHIDYKDKEPFYRSNTVLLTTKESIKFRYSILKHYYSEFIKLNGVGMIFKPLFFEFDSNKYPILLDRLFIEKQFMIGSSLMVIPNLTKDNSYDNELNKTTYSNNEAFFPGLMENNISDNNTIDWYDLRDYTKVKSSKIQYRLNEMPAVYLKSGSLILANSIESDINSTKDLDENMNIISSLNKDHTSRGGLFLIEDMNNKQEILECQLKNCWLEINISERVENNMNIVRIKLSKVKNLSDSFNQIKLNKLRLMGSNILNNKENYSYTVNSLKENNKSYLQNNKLVFENDSYSFNISIAFKNKELKCDDTILEIIIKKDN